MSSKITIENGIATFTIDRPERRNAVNTAVMDGLEEFIERIENNPDIAFAVITGEGDQCILLGRGLAEFHNLRTAEEAFPMLSRMAGILYKIATLPVPVIALVNGVAVGGGCEIAMACDYRVVSSQAKAGFIQGTLAITTGWGGATLLFEKDGKHDRCFVYCLRPKYIRLRNYCKLDGPRKFTKAMQKMDLHSFFRKCLRFIPLFTEPIRQSPFGNGLLILFMTE